MFCLNLMWTRCMAIKLTFPSVSEYSGLKLSATQFSWELATLQSAQVCFLNSWRRRNCDRAARTEAALFWLWHGSLCSCHRALFLKHPAYDAWETRSLGWPEPQAQDAFVLGAHLLKGSAARPSLNTAWAIFISPPCSVWRRNQRAGKQFQLAGWGQTPEQRGPKPPGSPSTRRAAPLPPRTAEAEAPTTAPPPALAIGGSERRGALSVWMGAPGAGAQAQRRGAVEAGGAEGPLGGEEGRASSGPRDLRRAGAGGARLPPAVPLPGEEPPARGPAWGRGRGHPSVAWGGRCCSCVASAALSGLAGPREVSSEASEGAPRRELTGRGVWCGAGWGASVSRVWGPPALFGWAAGTRVRKPEAGWAAAGWSASCFLVARFLNESQVWELCSLTF